MSDAINSTQIFDDVRVLLVVEWSVHVYFKLSITHKQESTNSVIVTILQCNMNNLPRLFSKWCCRGLTLRLPERTWIDSHIQLGNLGLEGVLSSLEERLAYYS
jgi:hypothetical protein